MFLMWENLKILPLSALDLTYTFTCYLVIEFFLMRLDMFLLHNLQLKVLEEGGVKTPLA